jgi:hypothetical protein
MYFILKTPFHLLINKFFPIVWVSSILHIIIFVDMVYELNIDTFSIYTIRTKDNKLLQR